MLKHSCCLRRLPASLLASCHPSSPGASATSQLVAVSECRSFAAWASANTAASQTTRTYATAPHIPGADTSSARRSPARRFSTSAVSFASNENATGSAAPIPSASQDGRGRHTGVGNVSNGFPTHESRLRRTVLYVPGCDEKKLKSSCNLTADTLVYDLEDGVPEGRKGEARQLVMDTLEASEHGKNEKSVRINGIGSGFEVDDLNVMLRSKRLESIVIPKVQSPRDVEFVSRMVDSVCPSVTRAGIRLIASIESALGLMNLKEIAQCDPRLDALIFAAEDLCAEMGLIRTSHRREMLFARQQLVITACAYGLQAIDIVCFDYKNTSILEEECREAREWGFSGKQAIHPKQIDIIQKAFEPTQSEFNWASKIVHGYEAHTKLGIGAFNLDGKVVDLPVVKWAERLIARGKQVGLKES